MEYTLQDYCNRIREDVKDYDYILIGLGDEALNNNDGNLIDMLNKFGELLDKNNYFIISSTKHNYLGESTINPKRMVCPYINEDEKQWDFYNKWLSATLAKKLLVIEIGEGFNNPNLIRWPFERIVMINDKAHFYRAHSTFYQIPKEIRDIMYEHQGTTFLAYFYNKAKSLDPSVTKEEFRYSGPKPRTKESAIIMLADSIEAAVRSIDDKTPRAMEEMIRKIISSKIEDNQLSEADLTFKEIEIIIQTFIKSLVSIHHVRIKYPGQK